MSDFAARAALSRMNMREVAMAPIYSGFASDMHALSRSDSKTLEEKMVERRFEMAAAYGFNTSEQRKPFAFANGLAIIPVTGSLINRFNGSYEGYATGYNFIRRQLALAMGDEDVRGIIFDVNSYGGEAAGCFELAADIRAARAIKPSMAMVDSNAYSAGFALATAAGRVVTIPSAGVGSVGVITMHVDMSKMLEDFGIKVSLIYEAEHKADGNPFEPLPDSVRAEVQARIHTSYERFVAVAAENLAIDAKIIRDTKSRTYGADEALKLGLIHAIESPSVAAQAFFDGLSGSTTNLRTGANMTTAKTEPGADTQAATTQAATATAAQEARTAERTRVSGILSCEEAKGREAMANHIAMNTDMSLADAKAMLAAAPVAKAADPAPAAADPAPAAAAANPFAAAMDATKNPNVGAGAATADEAATPSQQILADYQLATGRKLGGDVK